MNATDFLQQKLIVVTEVGRALRAINAPVDTYHRLFECLDRGDYFWRKALQPNEAWTTSFWIWFLFKQREAQRENPNPATDFDDGSFGRSREVVRTNDDGGGNG